MPVKTNQKLTKLTKKVLKAVQSSKAPLRPSELQSMLGNDLKIRSIRYAIQVLEEADLIERKPDLYDLRSYYITPKHQAKSAKSTFAWK